MRKPPKSDNSLALRTDFADLRRVHELAAARFPHEYLDVGLGAVGLFLHEPPKNAGYRGATPRNSVTFAGIGVDGIHFGSVTDGPHVDPASPVVLTIPMAFETPNHIVGATLHDFLCLGCRRGYSNLGNLHLNLDATISHYQSDPGDQPAAGDFFDARVPGILQLMCDELGLNPWDDVRGRFLDLQARFRSTVLVSDDGNADR